MLILPTPEYLSTYATAQGITDAFHQAEWLAAALDDVFAGRATEAVALAGYQRTRDAAVRRMFDFTCMLAPMEPLPAFVRMLFRSMEGNPAAMDRFMGVFAGTVPIPQFFNPLNVLGILGRRALHGRPAPSAPLATGTR